MQNLPWQWLMRNFGRADSKLLRYPEINTGIKLFNATHCLNFILRPNVPALKELVAFVLFDWVRIPNLHWIILETIETLKMICVVTGQVSAQ